MKTRIAVVLTGLLLTAQPILAQPRERHPIRSRIVWTAVGALAGTVIGAAATWDDDVRAAVLQKRMRRAMMIGGGTGAAVGFSFGSFRSRPSPAFRPPLARAAVAETQDPRAKKIRPALIPGPGVNLLSPAGSSDPLWEGLLIGGALGAVGGMVLVPPMFCGRNDAECTAIVRVAVGLPIMAGGFVAGALIDKFHQQGHLVWISKSKRRITQLDPMLGPTGTGVQLSVRFR
jgi:hypothetical protein